MSTETLPANDASKTTNDVYFRCFKGCEGRHSVFDGGKRFSTRVLVPPSGLTAAVSGG